MAGGLLPLDMVFLYHALAGVADALLGALVCGRLGNLRMDACMELPASRKIRVGHWTDNCAVNLHRVVQDAGAEAAERPRTFRDRRDMVEQVDLSLWKRSPGDIHGDTDQSPFPLLLQPWNDWRGDAPLFSCRLAGNVRR